MAEKSSPDDLWRLTVQHSPIGMTLVGIDGQLLTVNAALCDMLGYDAADLTRRGFQELTHPEDLNADLEAFERTLAGEIDSYRLSKRYLHASGRVVWGDLSVALVRDAAGQPVHFISQILDVTDQREAEARLRAASDKAEHDRGTMEAIFETVGVGLLLLGPNGRYERTNRRHQETMTLPFPDGHSGEAGQTGQVYLKDGRTRTTAEEMPSSRAMRGEEFDDQTYWVGSDPERRAAYSISARQVRGPDGSSRGAILAYQEVTQLLRSMQVQDEFVASVSHELRTPLSSVLGYLEIIGESEALPEDLRGQVKIIERNALRLRALVTDLLDVAQVREGALPLERGPVDLSALARDAVQAVLPAATEAGQEVDIEGPDTLVVDGDEQRLRQVVDNLLANAVKYSNGPGRIRVTVGRLDETVEIKVCDSGIGIAATEVDKVFDRFFRGETALHRHIPGAGLGLNIVRSIVEAHQGSISVASDPGRGSAFRVALPCSPS